jgi:hypothetical protein
MIDDLKTQEKKVTAKYANHAKKEADWGSLSRIWRISRLNLFASSRRSLSGLCAPVVKIRATAPRCPVSFRQQTQFPAGAGSPPSALAPATSTPPSRLCKTKPVPGAGWDGGGRTSGNSAKQTQSAADGQLCQTNPISPCAGSPGPTDRAKQSQFRQRVERVKCLPGNSLWWIGHARNFGETKPIEKKFEV